MKTFAALPLIGLLASSAHAVSLDVGSYYRMRALSYSNLNLGDPPNNRSFISQNAQLSVIIKDIYASPYGGEERLDVGLALRGLGVAGSSTALQAPFAQIGAQYPNTNFTPFLENAYVRASQLFGMPLETTLGQQNYTLGSGLLLSDDGKGMAGVSGAYALPWWNLRTTGFIFQPRNSQQGANSLMVYGLTLELPTEGLWQLNNMVEKDKSSSLSGDAQPLKRATRVFNSMRYQISYGPLVFDGEAAIQSGSAIPIGPTAQNPNGSNITFGGNAEVIKAKWRQPLWQGAEGIARISLARGSGHSGNATRDDAFFPSQGHRFDGLERSGFGDFFAATPYDAFGGHSTATATGLNPRLTGIRTVSLGITPPAYRGIQMDLDYFLYQAERSSVGPSTTLGSEIDVHFKYRIHEKLSFLLGGAWFRSGDATMSPGKTGAKRFIFEATARF